MRANTPDKKTPTHFNARGEVAMVDVGGKDASARKAVAEGRIVMRADTLAMLESGSAGKGEVLAVARVAGINAAKRTADLIPLCHPLSLTHIAVEFALHHGRRTEHKTEAPSVVSVAEGDRNNRHNMRLYSADDGSAAADAAVTVTATAATVDRTGVEMEALCAVQVALLTIYDMCKSVDRAMTISGVRLLEKSGGKSGEWRRE